MKVVLISPNIESEKALAIISKEMVKNISKRGVDINLITYISKHPFSLIKKIKDLRRYEIIHLHHEYNLLGYYGLPFFLILFLFKIFRKKVIITMHTVLPKNEKFQENKIKIFLRRILYLTQNKFINRFSDIIHVNEFFFKKILIKDYLIESKKIIVIPQGVRSDNHIPDKKSSRKKLSLKGKIYLIIGNLTVDSGADRIIRQADKIGKTILFVTDPKGANTNNKKKVEDFIKLNKEIIKKNNFQKYVRFDLKELPEDLWWNYLSACDLVIQAYRGGVRSGVFSEAMAAKKPVIASNINFFKEMEERYGSLIIAEEDKEFPAIIRTAMNPKNYQKMQKECERYIRENNWFVVAKKYKKIYEYLHKNINNQ